MGILRLLFALSVLTFHTAGTNGFYIFERTAAVVSFFIISGFYMALILDGKYKSLFSFYISRALRILPLYWIALFIIVVLGIIKSIFVIGGDNFFTHYLNYSQHLTGANFTIETINFIFRNLTLIINKDYFGVSENQSFGYLIVNQAWSLQAELLFYLVIPFILRIKKNFLFYVSLYAVIIHGFVLPVGLLQETSLTFLFANYFTYFLFGVISYKYVYGWVREHRLNNLKKIYAVFLFLVIIYQMFPHSDFFGSFALSLAYYIPFALFVPFVFEAFKNNRIDRFIGELSYPVYITHMIFIKAAATLQFPFSPIVLTLSITTVTLVFSVLLVKFVQNPIDRFRHHLKPPVTLTWFRSS